MVTFVIPCVHLLGLYTDRPLMVLLYGMDVTTLLPCALVIFLFVTNDDPSGFEGMMLVLWYV